MDDPSAPATETLSSLLDVLTMVSHGGRVQTEDRAWAIHPSGARRHGCHPSSGLHPPASRDYFRRVYGRILADTILLPQTQDIWTVSEYAKAAAGEDAQ